MLFVKKSKAASGQVREPAGDPVIDVVDITDVKEVTEPLEGAPATAEQAPTGRGVFLDAKPPVTHAAPAQSLRARFLRKSAAGATDATAPVVEAKAAESSRKLDLQKEQPAKPIVEGPASSLKSRLKWPGRKVEAETGADAISPAIPAEDTGPIGPTEKVRKPIIVRKASDRKRKFQELPIRVFMGYLPEVTERDARDYALGIAERNCEQISLVYYDAFKMNDGYGYEVHEGGSGRAYLPEIIEHFASQGQFEKGGSDPNVFIRTATRMVQVERTHDGLQAFQLPESATEVASDWVEGTSKMTPAIQTMTSVLIVGAALFTTGFLAMTLALVSRIQPYDPAPPPVVEKATDGFNVSPLSRWTTLQGVSGEEYVKALRFSNGKWDLDRGTAPAEPAAVPGVPAAGASAAPAATN